MNLLAICLEQHQTSVSEAVSTMKGKTDAPDLLHQLGEIQGRKGSILGWLEDDRTTYA
jgi:hypothetical protein